MSFLRYAKSGYRNQLTPAKKRERSRDGVGRSTDGRTRSDPRTQSSPTIQRLTTTSKNRRPAITTLPASAGARKARFLVLAAALFGGVGLGVVKAQAERMPVDASEQAPALDVAPALNTPAPQPEEPANAGGVENASDADKHATKTNAPGADAPTAQTRVAIAPPKPVFLEKNDRIRPGETLSVALTRHGVPMDEVNRLVVALRGVLDVRTIRPGDAYAVIQEGAKESLSKMDAFEFRPSAVFGAPTLVRAEREGEGYKAEKTVTPVDTKIVALKGEINSSLYMSMIDSGEGSSLVSAFADVFAWNIDFYRETQKGDTYKVIVEKQYADGRFIGYGKVLAAEYVNAGAVHRGFNFKSKDEKVWGVFDARGDSLERTFLKNPMEIARITSRYGQRFHPVLKRRRMHRGIDYGSPKGTPFWAVADGTVVTKKYDRGAGNMIVLRHANGIETRYFHASRFAKNLKVGKKVRQREVIGYVGSTGRSTGPHLHFEMKKRGHHVDPRKQKFPAAKPVPEAYTEEYIEAIAHLVAELDALEIS